MRAVIAGYRYLASAFRSRCLVVSRRQLIRSTVCAIGEQEHERCPVSSLAMAGKRQR
jgi:hypothetical protein